MNLVLFAVAATAAVNAPRALRALPERDRTRSAALGATAAIGVLAVLAALATPLADALQLTRPTVRMGAGAVAVVQGIVAICARPPRPEPSLPGRAAALVPVAFPVLLSPGLGLLAISGALDRSVPVAVGVLAVALATLPAASALRPRPTGPVGDRIGRALGAVFGAVLVVAGLAIVWNGTFDL